MKAPTRDEVTATIAKHEAKRRRGMGGPYTAYELTLTGYRSSTTDGSASAVRAERRAFNAAIRQARAAIARRK